MDTISHLCKARNKSLPHRHGGVHFSPLGAKLYFHVNTTRKNYIALAFTIVLTTNTPPTWLPCHVVASQELREAKEDNNNNRPGAGASHVIR